jgi:hypothetical protein
MQNDHKRTSHFQKCTENKFGLLRLSNLIQSLEEHIRFVSNAPGDYCFSAPSLGATSFESDYRTAEELACSAFSEERDCNSCKTCILHNILHGTTQPSIYLRLVQEIRAESVHLRSQEYWPALYV